MAENKVRFGLKNVYYSVLTEGSTNSFATPVAVPGAVSMTLDSNVANGTFYADNVSYYTTFANNGYTGTLEMARIPDSMLTAVFGMSVGSTDKILYEDSDDSPKPFALLFQIEGDQEAELNVLYRVVPTSKPTAGSQTVEEGVEPVTQSFDFQALPLVTGVAAQKGLIKGRTTTQTTTTIRSNWFSTVQIKTQ